MNKEKLLSGLKWLFRSFIWLFVLMYIIDMVTKMVVMFNMHVGESITLIPNFLWITYVQNKSAAFGMGFGDEYVRRWTFVLIATIGIGIILYIYIKKFKSLSMYLKACLMLILTGAVGNLTDRLFYAKSEFAVVDWINFFDNDFWHFPFNIADSCVVVGAIMLIVWLIVEEVKDYKKQALEAKAEEKPEKILSEEEKSRYTPKEEESAPKVEENEPKE